MRCTGYTSDTPTRFSIALYGPSYWMVARPCLKRGYRRVLSTRVNADFRLDRPSNIILTSFCVAWTANVWVRKRYPRFFANFIYVIRWAVPRLAIVSTMFGRLTLDFFASVPLLTRQHRFKRWQLMPFSRSSHPALVQQSGGAIRQSIPSIVDLDRKAVRRNGF